MTKPDFLSIFMGLMNAYTVQFTPGQIESFFEELHNSHPEDFAHAAKRIPANEVRGFPPAKVIMNYVLDAKEGRILREKAQMPRDIEQVLSRHLKHDRTKEQVAWAKLCTAMIKCGILTIESRNRRCQLIKTFIDTYHLWLSTRYDIREWLYAKLKEVEVTHV